MVVHRFETHFFLCCGLISPVCLSTVFFFFFCFVVLLTRDTDVSGRLSDDGGGLARKTMGGLPHRRLDGQQD